jgi:hypothetical protein
MLFGSNRDYNTIRRINRELLSDIVEQEILYYKPDLENMVTNLYGESMDKAYKPPVKLECLITRGDQVVQNFEFGPDDFREMSFAFLRDDLVDRNVFVEKGDIVVWNEYYFEVDHKRENQLFVGRDKSYNLTDYGSRFGTSHSIIADAHLTRAELTGITRVT